MAMRDLAKNLLIIERKKNLTGIDTCVFGWYNIVMLEAEEQQGNDVAAELPPSETKPSEPGKRKKPRTALKVLRIVSVLLLIVLVVAIMLNALLSIFKKGYYTTFGKYRLFAVVTDSMEPTVGKGCMIVDKKPTSAADVTVDSVITFEVHTSSGVTLFTHRVIRIEEADGTQYYITRGDNAAGEDPYRTVYSDIVGIYTGKKCPVLGSVLGFLQSVQGVITLIVMLFIIIIMWCVLSFMRYYENRRKLDMAALKKSGELLACVNLRYDNINEITAVMDVLTMIGDEENLTRDERDVVQSRLREFIGAATIELPQGPETAAILDSLPAPDTPSSLVAALAAGATLRQAEDGQTLVLTTISGEKSMLLTPVQTADGIILCQQGVRLRSDIAPNIEEIGETSMPGNPEFFEGQPLEKKVVYPELPQPDKKFGAEMLAPNAAASADDPSLIAAAIAAPMPVGASGNLPEPVAQSKEIAAAQPAELAEVQSAELVTTQTAELVATGEPKTALPKKPRQPRPSTLARKAFAKYREFASQLELRQAEQLRSLLNDTETLTPDEKTLVAEYKAAHPKKKRPPRTPEQRAAAREAAERRKQAEEAFVNSLNKKDREIYLTEQKLAKARAAAIRKLRRIANDRKLLEKMDDE